MDYWEWEEEGFGLQYGFCPLHLTLFQGGHFPLGISFLIYEKGVTIFVLRLILKS